MSESASPALNQLANSASTYLRSAAHQPVDWLPWSEAAFARAQAEDKPILLDIGAVWCHWCHVMDGESYEDPAVAEVINRHFVAVKVDRDERPDVDSRYQAAVQAISGQGGWPLTGFLSSDGRPFYGTTYIPRDERYGRAGIIRVLESMAQVWRERRTEALNAAASVMAAIENNENVSGRQGELSRGLIDKIIASIVAQFDPHHGGFGAQPKFPHPGALDLLLAAAARGNEKAREAFTVTLEKMAAGGVYDQLAGGFHRYSVDERWVVPHFEKMLYDNTELLRNYVHGYQALGNEEFLRTAREIVAWLDGVMTDGDRGGFYGSQDADVGLDDDGDYFTWTADEARAALDPDEFEAAALWWDIGAVGDMHHNPAKNVLHRNYTIEQLAEKTGKTVEQASAEIASAKTKLLAARLARPTPFIDRTLYTSWNAMAVTAYFEAARAANIAGTQEFALRTLDRLLYEAWDGEQTLGHVIAYPEGGAPAEVAPGTLDDYAFTIHACIDGWLASQEMKYYRAAVKIADAMIARFYDRTACAFLDSAIDGGSRLGVLAAKRKPLQDVPTPAGNPTGASALLRLGHLSGRADYSEIAEDTLASFAGIAGQYRLHAGSYALAVERLLGESVQIVVVGSGDAASQLQSAAEKGFSVSKTVIRVSPAQLVPGAVPEALAETLLNAPKPAGADAWALVCKGHTCLPPIADAAALAETLSCGN